MMFKRTKQNAGFNMVLNEMVIRAFTCHATYNLHHMNYMSECHLCKNIDIFSEASQQCLPHIFLQTTGSISIHRYTQFLICMENQINTCTQINRMSCSCTNATP